MVARERRGLAELLDRDLGRRTSGLPKPRSITSCPSRRSSSFSRSTSAKAYGRQRVDSAEFHCVRWSQKLSPCCGARRRCPRSSGAAARRPPRRRRGSGAAASTWIAFIGSTYGLRSRTERCSTGWRSSSSRRLDDLEHGGDDARVLGGDRLPEARVVDELEVLDRDLDARLRERHLEVLDERAEERPVAVEPAQLVEIRLGERAAAAVPRRQQAAVLRPREHPRDRAQRREVAGALGPARGARADLEQRELVHRRERAEERRRSARRRRARGTRRATARRARRRSPRRRPACRRRRAPARRRAASRRARPRGCGTRGRAART